MTANGAEGRVKGKMEKRQRVFVFLFVDAYGETEEVG
jgi:hypothetical protein